MGNPIKDKIVNGAIWSLIERFGYLTIQFITNIVLARLLSPNEFGTIGILLIFTNLSLVLVDGGLASALIQKKEISEDDKNTVFYTNLAVSGILYLLLFVTAPWIADFFKSPSLTLYLRVISVIIIIDAFSSIQNTILNRIVNFKRIAYVKVVAATVSTLISIIAAYLGAGIWSLIIQYLSYSLFRSFLLWQGTEWRPSRRYSSKSFKVLFSFGSKLLLSTFIAELYNHFQSIVIGRKFLAKDLGYFTQAKQLQNIPVGAISNTINAVSFPVYASLQDDKEKLVHLVRTNLKGAIFLNFPLMFFLALEAEDILVFLYSDKWLPSVPYFQFLCLGFGLLLIVHQTNLSILKALGKSDMVLYLEIIKKMLGISFILIATNIWGIMGIMYALTLNSIIEIFLNGYCVGRNIEYGIVKQLKDIIPTLSVSAISFGVVYVLRYIVISKMHHFEGIVLSLICFSLLYVLLSKLFRLSAYKTYKNLVKEKIVTIKGNGK